MLDAIGRLVRDARIWIWSRRVDIAIAAILGAVSAALVLWRAPTIDPSAYEPPAFDVYFSGDLPRVYEQMTARFHDGFHTQIHPLFVLFANPPALALQRLFGADRLHAMWIELAAVAATWSMLLYAVLRLAACVRPDAALFTGVGIAGASSVFWFVVPETFSYGACGLLLALAVGAIAARRAVADWVIVGAGLATFAFTFTNSVTGAVLALMRRPFLRALQIGLNVLALGTLLWGLERRIYPSAVFFLEDPKSLAYLERPTAGRMADVSRVFFLHSAVMPAVEACNNRRKGLPPHFLSVQAASVGSSGGIGIGATIAWTALLLGGLFALARGPGNGRLRLLIALSLAAQFVIHSAFGGETFLYAMHWWSFLVPAAALATLTRWRRGALVAAVVFIALASINNMAQWRHTTSVFTAGFDSFPVNSRICRE